MAVYNCIRIVQKDLISSQLCCVQIRELHNLLSGRGGVVILLDWSGVDLTPKSNLYAEKAVELQGSNMDLD